MAITRNAIRIPQEWVNLNELASVSFGDSFIIQNLGPPGDLISIAISDSAPEPDFYGVALNQLNPMAFVDNPDKSVWVRFYRFDSMDSYPQITGLIQVIPPQGSIYVGLGGAIASGQGSGSTGQIESNPMMNEIRSSVSALFKQLKLLNYRIEEAFETRIKLEDIEHED